MLTKEKIIQSINALPDKFSLDDVLESIVLLQKIEMGLEQSKAGQTLSTGVAKRRLNKWLE
ncbi:MAG: hypothetical protein JKY52_15900 [Flavobacteriales bacterium]|nr:hypothetical protein [Flavobacteriales bacterium]